jgi:DNA-binding MarR family transcriptional regulator
VPELRHLRVFVAVAQERNFTRAAERLHLAQQAVSKSIAGLERELGVELLTRTSREVRLTQAGRALLGDAREILAAADDAFARAREHGRRRAGAIAIGATPAVGTALLQDLTVALRRDAPRLAVACARRARARRPPSCASGAPTSSLPARRAARRGSRSSSSSRRRQRSSSRRVIGSPRRRPSRSATSTASGC